MTRFLLAKWAKPAVASVVVVVGLAKLFTSGVSMFAKLAVVVVLLAAGFVIVTAQVITRSAGDDIGDAEDAADRVSADGVDRRTALRMLSAGTLGAVPFLTLPSLLNSVTTNQQVTKANTSPAVGAAGRTRQWTMIIDLRRCDGCQSQGTPPKCTAACIEGHLAPEPMQWIEIYEEELAGGGTRFLPTPCQQCQNAPCVNVCPVGATFATPEGLVLIDQERCIGCRICMAACPYDRRFFNWGDPPIPPQALLADYNIEHQAPARRGTVMKCDFCPDLARAGALPYCVQGCPQNAIFFGDLEEDIATNGRELVRVRSFLSESDAFREKEELGTHPRVYYIPGHGEDIGRNPYDEGRKATEWEWAEVAEGGTTWSR
jgi:molybdopterin-containing oxidoreductase family iron-sulfur binding subunit